MTIKMKKHDLYSNWQIVFMSDTNKQTHEEKNLELNSSFILLK